MMCCFFMIESSHIWMNYLSVLASSPCFILILFSMISETMSHTFGSIDFSVYTSPEVSAVIVVCQFLCVNIFYFCLYLLL